MKWRATILAAVCLAAGSARAADPYRQVIEVKPLPIALNNDFQFRKTKQFLLGYTNGKAASRFTKPNPREPSIGFESSYRLFGAVTALDRRSRNGDYLDFFWRARGPATVTVRLEYRQEKLRVHTQAREVDYPNAKGSHHTAFAVIGDDFANDGRILSWRCLLIANGQIVAQTQSFLWR